MPPGAGGVPDGSEAEAEAEAAAEDAAAAAAEADVVDGSTKRTATHGGAGPAATEPAATEPAATEPAATEPAAAPAPDPDLDPDPDPDPAPSSPPGLDTGERGRLCCLWAPGLRRSARESKPEDRFLCRMDVPAEGEGEERPPGEGGGGEPGGGGAAPLMAFLFPPPDGSILSGIMELGTTY